MAPLLSRTLAEVPPAHAGAASGVVEPSIQLGITFGITLIGLVYFAARTPTAALAASALVAVLLRGNRLDSERPQRRTMTRK